MTNKLDLGNYNVEKDEATGVLTCTPIVKKPPVPRLTKAPKYTPIEVRDDEYEEWDQGYSFVKFNPDHTYKWKTGGSSWKCARLIPGYRYAWDPSWELFMEDDLTVKIDFADGTWREGRVGDFPWGYNGARTIVAFEVIE